MKKLKVIITYNDTNDFYGLHMDLNISMIGFHLYITVLALKSVAV